MAFIFKEDMKQLIRENIECEYDDYDCKNCDDNEECYMRADSICSHEYVKSIGYGGYNTEDEFWENL